MKIELLIRRYTRMIGLARYTTSLQDYLSRIGIQYGLVEPGYPFPVRVSHSVLKRFGLDIKTFFSTYPLAANFEKGTIKHLTCQQMACMLTFNRKLFPVIVTVHDIVPYLMRNDPYQNNYMHSLERFFDHLAMQNLCKADQIIAVSGYTKKMLVERLGCAAEKIEVVLEGVDHDLFSPRQITDDFRARYQLKPDQKTILYVGSENPRKNLFRLVQAFARVKEQIPEAILIKTGSLEYSPHYDSLRALISDLGLADDVKLFGYLPQDDLVSLYNAADLFVFPSLFEGFGLPVLEAMACGTPVVCSNTSSLPEVAGDAAILVDPFDVDAIANAIIQVLRDQELAQDLCTRGLERVKGFTWENTARQTLQVYQKVGGDL